jgi:hypothetical protein
MIEVESKDSNEIIVDTLSDWQSLDHSQAIEYRASFGISSSY